MINLCARRKQKTCKYPPQSVPCHPVTCVTHTLSHPAPPLRFIGAKATALNPSAPHCHLHFMPPGFFWSGNTLMQSEGHIIIISISVATQRSIVESIRGSVWHSCWCLQMHWMAMKSTHTLLAPSTNLCTTILGKTVCRVYMSAGKC